MAISNTERRTQEQSGNGKTAFRILVCDPIAEDGIEALKRSEAYALIRSCKGERGRFQGTGVRGKTLGIVGLGQVGSEVARRAKGLEMRVLAHDPFVPEERARVLGVDVVPMETLVKESDYITVHTTLTEGTKHLIGSAELRSMKPSARVINTARGGIVDEAALKQALDEEGIAGGAIDVWGTEPLTSHPPFGAA